VRREAHADSTDEDREESMKSLNADDPGDAKQMDDLLASALDITGAFTVLIQEGENDVLWVNVNGICVLRICRIAHLDIQAIKPRVRQEKR
jgi:hypothetical protein